ncbi:hypothetical protein FACS189450_03980 [Spirochaetia bacterium]|nr:hypothetical protein FACS189450_03980 [Spirochaetia bacterium]
MKFVDINTMNDFDVSINQYLFFLVHVQKSSLLQVSKKMEIFDTAKEICSEIKANVLKTLNDVHEFNFEEKKTYVKKSLLNIEKNIANEINNNKSVKIGDSELPLLNKIIETLKTDVNGIHLSSMDISNIYSFRDLNKKKDKGNDLDDELTGLKKKINTELEEIKKKTFLSLLLKENIKPELFYKINNFILDKCKKENIRLFVSNNVNENYEGLFFIISKENLTIRRKNSNGLIEYTIKFIELEGKFDINICGIIIVNNSEDKFIIKETYPNNMKNQIINAYNIRQIIDLFNVLYKNHLSENEEPDEDNNDIDDYLDGNIKND